jgi:hypothetical protein
VVVAQVQVPDGFPTESWVTLTELRHIDTGATRRAGTSSTNTGGESRAHRRTAITGVRLSWRGTLWRVIRPVGSRNQVISCLCCCLLERRRCR